MEETGARNQTSVTAHLPVATGSCSPLDEPSLDRYVRVGPYALIEAIAKGGTGVVWRAVHVTLRQTVAVKVLDRRPDTASGLRFLREARMGARLRHRYATEVHNAGVEPDGTLWLAMDLVEGQTAWHFVKSRGPMPLRSLVHFLGCLGEVLTAAHQLGVAHRDVSPGNVMVTLDGTEPEPRLLDLGLARWLDEAPLTEQNIGMGTPGYVSPEQRVNAADAGPLADLYSLGRLATFLLTGQPELTSPAIPAALLPVLARATDAAPESRYPDVASFVREFGVAAGPLVEVVAEPERTNFLDRFGSPGPFQDLRDASGRQLYRRSAGLPRWADGELRRAEGRTWLALDAEDGMWRAEPSGLCAWRLDAPSLGARIEQVERRPQLSEDGRRLLGILALVGGEIEVGLVEPTAMSPARRELAIHELTRLDHARRVPGTDLLVCPADTRLPARWTPEEQAAVHAGIAAHAATSRELDVLRQGYRAAMRLGDGAAITAATGRLAQALMVSEGLVEATLAVMHAAEALVDVTPAAAAALVPLATELVFSEPLPEVVARIEVLLARIDAPVASEARALFAARARIVTGRAREGIELPDEMSHPLLTAQAWRLRITADAGLPSRDAPRTLAAAEGWFAHHWDDPDLTSLYIRLHGYVAYRQRQYQQAAALARTAAESARRLDYQVEGRMLGAAAHLEVGQYRSAIEAARVATTLAAAMQSPHRNARATFLERQARHRHGEDLAPRRDLAMSARVLTPSLRANVALTEATLARARGDGALTRELAELAGRAYERLSQRGPQLLAAALAVRPGDDVAAAAVAESGAAIIADATRSGALDDLPFAIQAIALLGGIPRQERFADLIRLGASTLSDPRPGRRREVLSISEALALCTSAPLPTPSSIP